MWVSLDGRGYGPPALPPPKCSVDSIVEQTQVVFLSSQTQNRKYTKPWTSSWWSLSRQQLCQALSKWPWADLILLQTSAYLSVKWRTWIMALRIFSVLKRLGLCGVKNKRDCIIVDWKIIIFYAPHVTFYFSGYLLYSVNVNSYIRYCCNKYAICGCNFHFIAISDLHEVFLKCVTCNVCISQTPALS